MSFDGSHFSQGPSRDGLRARARTVAQGRSICLAGVRAQARAPGLLEETKEGLLALPPGPHWPPFWQTMLPTPGNRLHLPTWVCLLDLECFSHSNSTPAQLGFNLSMPTHTLYPSERLLCPGAGFPPLNCVHAIRIAVRGWRCSWGVKLSLHEVVRPVKTNVVTLTSLAINLLNIMRGRWGY